MSTSPTSRACSRRLPSAGRVWRQSRERARRDRGGHHDAARLVHIQNTPEHTDAVISRAASGIRCVFAWRRISTCRRGGTTASSSIRTTAPRCEAVLLVARSTRRAAAPRRPEFTTFEVAQHEALAREVGRADQRACRRCRSRQARSSRQWARPACSATTPPTSIAAR